jgi:dsDNA-specific endonuclease/ATPase MutS2
MNKKLTKRLDIGNKIAVIDDVLKGKIVAIDGCEITLEDHHGMRYQLLKKEVVRIDEDQDQMSKFSDINNSFLKEKKREIKSKKSLFVKEKNELILEVDLHVNQLTNSTRGMDNYDILSLQIETAKRKIEYAISKQISKVVFIHGVGEGVLKTELAFLLNNYNVKFYDASYPKYGLGATEVYIYQNPKS